MGNEFSLLWYTVGISMGMMIGSTTDYDILKKYTFKQADLNGDEITQELIASKRNKNFAYFPDTKENYVIKKDFDFSTLTNLEKTVEAEE